MILLENNYMKFSQTKMLDWKNRRKTVKMTIKFTEQQFSILLLGFNS